MHAILIEFFLFLSPIFYFRSIQFCFGKFLSGIIARTHASTHLSLRHKNKYEKQSNWPLGNQVTICWLIFLGLNESYSILCKQNFGWQPSSWQSLANGIGQDEFRSNGCIQWQSADFLLYFETSGDKQLLQNLTKQTYNFIQGKRIQKKGNKSLHQRNIIHNNWEELELRPLQWKSRFLMFENQNNFVGSGQLAHFPLQILPEIIATNTEFFQGRHP